MFFAVRGQTVAVQSCEDVDRLEGRVEFSYCPVCGGIRDEYEGESYLDHDDDYSSDLH